MSSTPAGLPVCAPWLERYPPVGCCLLPLLPWSGQSRGCGLHPLCPALPREPAVPGTSCSLPSVSHQLYWMSCHCGLLVPQDKSTGAPTQGQPRICNIRRQELSQGPRTSLCSPLLAAGALLNSWQGHQVQSPKMENDGAWCSDPAVPDQCPEKPRQGLRGQRGSRGATIPP